MRKISIHPLLLLALLLAAGALGHLAIQDARGAKASLSLADLRNFTEAFEMIKKQYVDEIDDGTLLRNAMRGMVSELDPFTTYLDHDELKQFEIAASGEFGGLGIVITKKEERGNIHIVSPIDGTPAQRAGVRGGDQILMLDDKSVYDVSLHDAVQIMRGKPGTDITLTLTREGLEKPLTLTITRAIIKIKSVRSSMLEPGYGYVRVSHFQNHTGKDFRKHLEELQDQSDEELKGIILDLRNNPGGLYKAAVQISDALLDYRAPIVSTRGRANQSNAKEFATQGDVTADLPVVVLINKGSASASEIVAGALQDNDRAQLLGTRSFGKGSVQTLIPLKSRDAALKLTTARYYTPSGRSIHEKGIEPDYQIEFVKKDGDDSPTAFDPDVVVRDNQIEAALELLQTGELRTETREANAQ